MKKRKLWFVLLAVAAALLAGGVVAYLTSAEQAKNVFTIGEVEGILREPEWDKEDNPGQNLVANQTVAKDPVVTNTGKNSAYVFLRVLVPLRELTVLNEDETKQDYTEVTELFSFLHKETKQNDDGSEETSYVDGFHLYDGTEESGKWIELTSKESFGIKDSDTTTYVFGYRIPLEPGETTETLFDAVRIADYIEGEIKATDSFDIVVEAYMIQASYVEDENGADITVREQDADGNYLTTKDEDEALLTQLYEIYVNQNGQQDYDLYRLGVDKMKTDAETGYILAPEEPTKDGYIFVGWYDGSVTRTVTTGGDDGDGSGSQSTEITGPQDHIYIFDTEEEAEAAKTDHGITFPVDPATLPEDGLVIYPGYVPITYTVYFHKGIGDEEPVTQTFYYDETKALRKNEYTLSGHKFIGWSFSENGNVNMKDERIVSMKQLTSADVTEVHLYAIWKSAKAKITYHANTGTFPNGMALNEVQIVGKIEDEKAVNELQAGTYMEPEHVTYAFGGWYKDEACTDGNEVEVDKNGVPVEAVDGDTDLYAKWRNPVVTYVIDSNTSYQVSYQWDNGQNATVSSTDAAAEKAANEKADELSESAIPFHYGWAKTADSTSADFDLKERVKADMSVYLVKARNISCTKSVLLDFQGAQDLKKWNYEADTVKYAVTLYGIQVDQNQSSQTIGLTFGPASGASDQVTPENSEGNYKNAYVSHSPWGTTAKGNKHRCIHDDTWSEIISWASKDPQVYEQCLYMGTRWTADGDDNGDGAGVLFNSINEEYLMWNATLEMSTDHSLDGSNKGGWPASRIRAVLNGAQAETADGTHTVFDQGAVAGTDIASMTEETSFLALFPEELRNAIVKRKVKSDTVYDDAQNNNVITYDKLWLASGSELLESSDDYDSDGFGTAYNYYSRCLRQHEGVGDTRASAAYPRQHKLGNVQYTSDSIPDGYLSQNQLYDENGVLKRRWTRTIDDEYESRVYYISSNQSIDKNFPTSGYGQGIGIAPFFCVGVSQ